MTKGKIITFYYKDATFYDWKLNWITFLKSLFGKQGSAEVVVFLGVIEPLEGSRALWPDNATMLTGRCRVPMPILFHILVDTVIHYSILDEIEVNRSVLHRLRFPIHYNSLWVVYQMLHSDWSIQIWIHNTFLTIYDWPIRTQICYQ